MTLTSSAQSLPKASSMLEHLDNLIARKSVTPNDAGCQPYLVNQLQAVGFNCHQFEINGVSNLVAKIGCGNIRIAFAGHTDVVPAGNTSLWQTAPFEGTIKDNCYYGRGVADMKGGIAAMLSAFSDVKHQLNLDKFSFYFLITSDEEGEAEFGTQEIVSYLSSRNELPHFCIIGEPSASEQTGDVIKVGRRGTISGEIALTGKQGHVAYPQHACNAAHKAAKVATILSELNWDQGSVDFPGTSLQVTGIDTGRWTDNVIPGQSQICFNVRYSHLQTETSIQQKILEALSYLGLEYEVQWLRPCLPYFTETEPNFGINLVSEVEKAIFDTCHLFPRLSTSGGTSDGRFIAQPQCQVIELGVPNHSIHQINEHVALNDLYKLEVIYQKLLSNIMQ